MRRLSALPLFALLACNGGEDEPSPLLDIPASQTWVAPGLSAEAFIVFTEGGIPHVYAENEVDAARLLGFVTARDRYFFMALGTGLADGTISELLGADALEADQEARGNGMRHMVDGMLANFDDQQMAVAEAYALGVNDYVEQVRQGNLPAPSELEALSFFLGAREPVELMTDFTARNVAAIATVAIYESSFETGDVGRARDWIAAQTTFDGAPLEAERKAGLLQDVWFDVTPVTNTTAAQEFVPLTRGNRSSGGAYAPSTDWIKVPDDVLDRTFTKGRAFQEMLGQNWTIGWGSNTWAVSGDGTASGGSILAADGHLGFTIPAFVYQVHIDTKHLSGEGSNIIGMMIPGTTSIAFGTNGKVAWGQTQLMGDVSDWYQEVIRLDAQGEPKERLFNGTWEPLTRLEESYVIKDVPLLGSEGRTETWARWITADGRFLMDVEGQRVSGTTVPGAGQSVINVRGDYLIPGDTNGDEIITALSMDYTGFDAFNLFDPLLAFRDAQNVDDFAEGAHGLVATSWNHVAADSQGNIFYTGYQATPCRGYLDRRSDGSWADGADPNLLLDGTKYPGFTVPLVNGRVDETQASDPQKCMVPFDEYPHEKNPARAYVASANTDPGNVALDGDLFDDKWYIGGPWMEGYRHQTLDTVLSGHVADGGATLEDITALQTDHRAPIAADFVPELLDAIATGRALEDEPAGDDTPEKRIGALYRANETRFEEVATRLTAWGEAGYLAESGVETFYHTPPEGADAHSVAVTLWASWYGHWKDLAIHDEGMNGGWKRPTGGTGELRLIKMMLASRGTDNPNDMGSWSDIHEESAFWDIRSTEPIERSDEIALMALVQALDFLASEPTADGAEGGFGTADMSQYRWGLRHWCVMPSIIEEFFGSGGPLDSIISDLSINTARLPLAPDMASDDPRKNLPGFPYHGDNEGITGVDQGFGGTRFRFGAASVWRYAFELTPTGVRGFGIIPGGQSGITESEHFDDQAQLWLADAYLPTHYTVSEVLEAAETREAFLPEAPVGED